MKCLLIFGQKFGSDNPSLIDLGIKIRDLGVTMNGVANDVSFAHWDDPTIIPTPIMIGHSYGLDRLMDIVDNNPSLQFEYVGGIDGVSRGWFPFFLWNFWKKWTMPKNVAKADFFQRALNLLPPTGSIGNADGVRYRNYPNIPSSHAEIPSNDFVVQTILKTIGGVK